MQNYDKWILGTTSTSMQKNRLSRKICFQKINYNSKENYFDRQEKVKEV
jgi:hypothetical protein